MSGRLPSLRPSEVLRALERARFHVVRKKGSHFIVEHLDDPRRHSVVPMGTRDLKRGTLHGILKDLRLTPEEFRELL